MYKTLGIINLVLLAIITSPYWLKLLGQWFFPKKKIASSKLMKVLRPAHKVLAICFLIITGIHGYLALGGFRLHTGTITAMMLLITIVLGGLFYGTKKPALFKWHKVAALLTVILVAVHFFIPNAIYYIFG